MDEFISAAVVGTAHYKNALPVTHSAVDTLTQQLPTGQIERAFLLAAGARAIYLQAGQQATEAAEPILPAAAETLAACSESVAYLFQFFLMAANTPLLPEALQRLRNAQLRLPHRFLPTWIIYGSQHKEYQPALIPVLGERGRWLSQFNANWQWVSDGLSEANETLPTDAETIWQEGNFEQRHRILQQLRAQDPEKARTWLEAVWRNEKAETRVAFLLCLQTGLSDADQAFIEQALEDRSEGVRQAAISLIHLMPDAPQMQKSITLISEMMDYKKHLLRGRLSVTLPENATLEWKNAIAISNLKQDDRGAEYWFLYGLAYIPPQHWERHFASTPENLVEIIKKTTYGKEMLLALMQAAELHHTPSWYTPLLTWYLSKEPSKESSSDWQLDETCRKMLSALPPVEREALIAPLQTDQKHWERAIQLLPAPWSSSFSQSCLVMLKNCALENDSKHYALWTNALPLVTLGLHPASLQQVRELENLPIPEKSTWQLQQQPRLISAFIELIQLRKRILEEI